MKLHRVLPSVRCATIGASLVLLGVPATALADRPPSVTCGSVVTRDVRLTTDLDCAGPGLVIGADGVRIDLGGHTLTGPGEGSGIDNNGRFDGVTIRNGTIRGFLHGIDLLETDHGRLTHVVLTGNGVGASIARSVGMEVDHVIVDANRFDGLSLTFSEQTTIRRSEFTRNGVSGVNELASRDTVYDRAVAADNALHGITISQTEGITITRTDASDNGGDGLNLGFWAFGAALDANRTNGNLEDGVQIDEAGSSIRRHVAVANTGTGIAAAPGTVDGGRNRATDNGVADCVHITCG
jgi:hypothetical protein